MSEFFPLIAPCLHESFNELHQWVVEGELCDKKIDRFLLARSFETY